MANRIQIRRDSSTNWSNINPVLAEGELGYETDTHKLKIGDGHTHWLDLPYYVTNDKMNEIKSAGISGPNGSIQYNDNNQLSGTVNLIWDSNKKSLKVNNSIVVSDNNGNLNITQSGNTSFISGQTILIDDNKLVIGSNSVVNTYGSFNVMQDSYFTKTITNSVEKFNNVSNAINIDIMIPVTKLTITDNTEITFTNLPANRACTKIVVIKYHTSEVPTVTFGNDNIKWRYSKPYKASGKYAIDILNVFYDSEYIYIYYLKRWQ